MARRKKSDAGYWRREATFGTVSLGKESAAIGCQIQLTEEDDLNALARMLVNSRLKCIAKVDVQGQADDPNQTTMIDDPIVLDSIVEIKRLSVGKGEIRTRLNFAEGSVETSMLERIKCCTGQIELKRESGAAAEGVDDPKQAKLKITSDGDVNPDDVDGLEDPVL